jgi:hypothetical protein
MFFTKYILWAGLGLENEEGLLQDCQDLTRTGITTTLLKLQVRVQLAALQNEPH